MPRFEDLVESGSPEELARLRRAHDALVAVGPPPELAHSMTAPRTPSRVSFLPVRRRGATALAAAAALAIAFGLGFWLGDRGEFPQSRSIAMRGVGPAQDASARILVGDRDSVGNWPLLLRVNGLRPLTRGWYGLYLTKAGKRVALCGTFVVKERGTTVIEMNAPYKLDEYDGWVVVAYDTETHEAGPTLLTTEDV